MKTVGFNERINTKLTRRGTLNLVKTNKKFFDVAMASQLVYIASRQGSPTELSGMNPRVSNIVTSYPLLYTNFPWISLQDKLISRVYIDLRVNHYLPRPTIIFIIIVVPTQCQVWGASFFQPVHLFHLNSPPGSEYKIDH